MSNGHADISLGSVSLTHPLNFDDFRVFVTADAAQQMADLQMSVSPPGFSWRHTFM